MTVMGGKLGMVNGLTNVRKWSIEETSDAKTAVSSATAGATVRRPGIKSWSASVDLFGGNPEVMPGDFLSFVGYRGPTTGVAGTAGIRSAGTAYVESLVINWNWLTNEFINTTLNLQGSGPVAHASGAAISDATVFNNGTPCGLTVRHGVTPTVLPDVISATLNITKGASVAKVSSSTACWTERLAGPAVDWTCSITQQNDLGVGPVAISGDVRLLLPASSGNDWDLQWGHLVSITGVVVDIETNAIIQQTLNFGMNAAVAGALGFIKRPGAVDWWPAP